MLDEKDNHWQRWLLKLAFVFFVNSLLSIVLMANGCGNYFALGVSYGDGQECQSWLERLFGITYFSQSSPLFVFDSLGTIIAMNWLLRRFFWQSSSAKINRPNRSKFWLVVIVGFAMPIILKEFLPS
jgi:hypothetical protein